MENYFWASRELKVLEEWDWMMKFLEVLSKGMPSNNDQLRRCFNEAVLIVSNKKVVVELEEGYSVICPFSELVSYIENKKVVYGSLLYYPVNFSNRDEYFLFLSGMREKMFADMED